MPFMQSPRKPGTRLKNGIAGIVRWLVPGLGVKRWFVVVLTGITLLGVGLAILLIDMYRTETSSDLVLTTLSYASLRFLPRFVRVIIFGGLGIGLILYGILQLNRSILRPFLPWRCRGWA